MATRTPVLTGKLLLSVQEAAILLGQTRATLYRAIRAGTLPLPIHRIGGRMKIPRAAIDRLLAGLDPTAPTAPERDQALPGPEGPDGFGSCPVCGRSGSPVTPRSWPMCSAARRSSSGTVPV